eukprot:TRINITY_DN19545_c0_g1_i2.p1 TRINITY_DN19545_c0_g1~~TRINITY_DN19545_c0_g1_i2.p1  ORF type:complete len:235 (-),score=92.54 TRINITY_DN19545_c0_g1_i2:51-755(-)
MNLWGKKKEAPRISDSIMLLRESLQTLDKREKHLEKQINAALEEAKRKAKAKDKRGALFQLKRKKMLEKEIDQIFGKKVNVETQIMALEGAASNKEILTAMRQGTEALKASMREVNIDNVDNVMEDITEAISLADEVGEAMAQPIGPVMDETDLERELAELEGQMTEEDLMILNPPIRVPAAAEVVAPSMDTDVHGLASLPAAPARAPVAPKRQETREEKEARELAELEASLNA